MWLRFLGDPNRDWTQPRCHVPVCSPPCCTAIKRLAANGRRPSVDAWTRCSVFKVCTVALHPSVESVAMQGPMSVSSHLTSHLAPLLTPILLPYWLRHATLNLARHMLSIDHPLFLPLYIVTSAFSRSRSWPLPSGCNPTFVFGTRQSSPNASK